MSCPIIMLPGWGNMKVHIKKLFQSFDAFESDKYMFDYAYNVPEDDIDTEKGVYAPFSVMKDRFYSYLNDNGLLNQDIDIVGFSEGGIIALFAAGQLDDIKINKYISISSPHRGAYQETFVWIHDNDSVTYELVWGSDFMKSGGEYEAVSENFFSKYPKEKLLQIYSPVDDTAIKKSVLRFKDKMEVFEVKNGNRWHVAMPNNPSVIAKVGSFLTD